MAAGGGGTCVSSCGGCCGSRTPLPSCPFPYPGRSARSCSRGCSSAGRASIETLGTHSKATGWRRSNRAEVEFNSTTSSDTLCILLSLRTERPSTVSKVFRISAGAVHIRSATQRHSNWQPGNTQLSLPLLGRWLCRCAVGRVANARGAPHACSREQHESCQRDGIALRCVGQGVGQQPASHRGVGCSGSPRTHPQGCRCHPPPAPAPSRHPLAGCRPTPPPRSSGSLHQKRPGVGSRRAWVKMRPGWQAA